MRPIVERNQALRLERLSRQLIGHSIGPLGHILQIEAAEASEQLEDTAQEHPEPLVPGRGAVALQVAQHKVRVASDRDVGVAGAEALRLQQRLDEANELGVGVGRRGQVAAARCQLELLAGRVLDVEAVAGWAGSWAS